MGDRKSGEARRSFWIHIICAIIVALFLIAVPIIAALSEPEATSGAQQKSNVPPELLGDPLHRLPSTPEEAHQRLQESRKELWPDEQGGLSASSVSGGVNVSIPSNAVDGKTNHANGKVRVKLVRSGTTIQTVNTKTNSRKVFHANLSAGDIKSGDRVQVQDLVSGPTVTINCTLTGSMSVGANKVSGTAPSGNKVDVYVRAPSTYYGDVPPGVAHKTSKGPSYSTTFTNVLDIRKGDVANVFSTDSNGNKVLLIVNSGGSLVVYPQYDDVMGFYKPHTLLTVKAGSASKKVGSAGDGFFEAWFTNHNIVTGEVVSSRLSSNRSITVQEVTANYDMFNNHIIGSGPANKIIRITMNPYVSPIVIPSSTNAQGSYDVDLTGKYTPTGTETFSVTWYDADDDCVIWEFPIYSWYLAEGYTGQQFDTYVLIQNPASMDANVTMEFQLETGTAPPKVLTVPAFSRTTVHLDELPGLGDTDVSTRVTCTNGATINAERAMYFVYTGDNLPVGRRGGHDSIGTLTPGQSWYLAEGYTGGEFDTYVLVQNPGDKDATVTLDFQLPPGASAPPFTFVLKGNHRYTVKLDDLPALGATDVSTRVTSDQPVVAERAMYFNFWLGDPATAKDGGSDSLGVRAPGKTWFMAEGYTGGQFDTYILVQNPSDKDANVTMSFQVENGSAPDHVFKLDAGGRKTVHLNELEGLSGGVSVSTKVTSDVDVVAERAMYFVYTGDNLPVGYKGGHTSNSLTAASTGWYLPEGYTGGTFDTYVLVQNSNTTPANVTMNFQLTSPATAPSQQFTIKPGARLTVKLNDLPGLGDTDVSTNVTSDVPVAVERAMYFNFFLDDPATAKAGGSDSVGIPY
jgi:Family of unknown function (DUF5719)